MVLEVFTRGRDWTDKQLWEGRTRWDGLMIDGVGNKEGWCHLRVMLPTAPPLRWELKPGPWLLEHGEMNQVVLKHSPQGIWNWDNPLHIQSHWPRLTMGHTKKHKIQGTRFANGYAQLRAMMQICGGRRVDRQPSPLPPPPPLGPALPYRGFRPPPLPPAQSGTIGRPAPAAPASSLRSTLRWDEPEMA